MTSWVFWAVYHCLYPGQWVASVGCCVQGLGRGGADISTQGDPERAKPESQALRILEAKIGVPLDPRGYRGAGRARTTVRCPALSLELRLRLTLGLGLAEG